MVWLLKKYKMILSQHSNYLQKWLVHFNSDMFTAAMFLSARFLDMWKPRTTFYFLWRAIPPGLVFMEVDQHSYQAGWGWWMQAGSVPWDQIFSSMIFIMFQGCPTRQTAYLPRKPAHIISSLFSHFCLFQNAILHKNVEVRLLEF